MENGSAVVKPLVTRTSDGVEDDTFVKRLEEGAPVAEEGVSGTEESASGTEEGACGTEESALLCSRASWCRAPGPNLTKMGTSPRPHHVPTLRPHGPIS